MPRNYEEIRGLLATQKLDGLSGKGASEEEIRIAESELDVRFPPSYRIFLREYGWGYFGSLELIAGLGSDIPSEWLGGANLLQVAADERRGPCRFPKEVIPFCQSGAGDWYALNCSQCAGEEVPIVLVAHEEVAANGFAAEVCADSFADWIFAKLSE